MSLPGEIRRGRLPPTIDLSITTNATGTEIQIELTREDDDPDFAASLKIRIYYVSVADQSPAVMNGGDWFASAQLVKKFVADISFGTTPFVTATVSALPYQRGGWFYAVQVDPSGRETFGSSPVLISDLNANLVAPNLATEQVQDVSVAMVNLNGIIQMTFQWQLPNVAATPLLPLGPLTNGHVQIWIYNYENRGDWRQFNAFDVRAKSLQHETGVVYYMPDFDGLHNVTVYFVPANSAFLYSSVFVYGVAPSVVLVGGIGP